MTTRPCALPCAPLWLMSTASPLPAHYTRHTRCAAGSQQHWRVERALNCSGVAARFSPHWAAAATCLPHTGPSTSYTHCHCQSPHSTALRTTPFVLTAHHPHTTLHTWMAHGSWSGGWVGGGFMPHHTLVGRTQVEGPCDVQLPIVPIPPFGNYLLPAGGGGDCYNVAAPGPATAAYRPLPPYRQSEPSPVRGVSLVAR